MDFKGIPVVPIGPGSQPRESDGAGPVYIDMPSEMTTYRAPALEHMDISRVDGARATIDWLIAALADYPRDRKPRIANLSGLDEESRLFVNELLGEGEVSVVLHGEIKARSQESVFTGVWRTVFQDDEERITHDLLEVADVVHLARISESNREIPVSALDELVVPDGVINARSILVELAAAASAYSAGDPAYAINLSLLPMSDDDSEFLDSTLGRGGVEILSRSYGLCVMLATAVENIWWVRYFNSMNTLILNTLEVTDVPQVACAAHEDIVDSAYRLADILDATDGAMS